MSFNLRVIVPSDPFSLEERKPWITEIIYKHEPDIIETQDATIPMREWLEGSPIDYIYCYNRQEIVSASIIRDSF